MKKQIKLKIGAILLSFLLSMSSMAQESYKVTLDKSVDQLRDWMMSSIKAVAPSYGVFTGHAFFDWKPDAGTEAIFKKYGVYYCNKMEAFFTSVLNSLE